MCSGVKERPSLHRCASFICNIQLNQRISFICPALTYCFQPIGPSCRSSSSILYFDQSVSLAQFTFLSTQFSTPITQLFTFQLTLQLQSSFISLLLIQPGDSECVNKCGALLLQSFVPRPKKFKTPCSNVIQFSLFTQYRSVLPNFYNL